MTIFKDRNGKAWEIDLNVGTVRRIKAHCQIDLGNIVKFGSDSDEGLTSLESLAEDVEKLCQVFWLLCEEQAIKQNLDEDSFFAQLDGDSLDAATSALLDEV